MAERPIATTSPEGLQPLGSAAQRSWELLGGTLGARLGAEYANLLAEPVAAQHGDRIDWYAPAGGETLPLSRLPEEEAQAVRDRLADMVAQVQAEAARLEESGTSDDLRLAEALRHAVEVPDDAMIHARRDGGGGWQPLLVHWAWRRAERPAVRGALGATLPHASAPVAGASVAQWAGLPWLILLGWLLLALMIAAILWLVLAPCALNPLRPGYCPAEAAGPAPATAETAVITDEIARLERELALADRLCQPDYATAPEPEAIPVPVPTPAPAEEDEAEATPKDAATRVTERGGAQGDLNFILEWASRDDVDLHVTCPGGETLSFLNRTGCNGAYDVDANVTREKTVTDPVENIVFDPALPGLYKVRIHLRSARSGGEVPVTLHVLRRDGRASTYTGKVSQDKETWTVNISISG